MSYYFPDGEQLCFWPDLVESEAASAIVRRVGRKEGLRPLDQETLRAVPLVLASGSASKCAVLRSLGLRVVIDPANIDETMDPNLDISVVVTALAVNKARAVGKRHPNALVIGADTMVGLGRERIGKPANREHAREILEKLSGLTHSIYTGLAVIDTVVNDESVQCCRTDVTFRKLSSRAIERYLRSGEPVGKAGAYALQGMGALLIERIDGEYTNVLGLPVQTLVKGIGDIGYDLI